MRKSLLASVLATSFLSGEATFDETVLRANNTLGRPWNWLKPLTRRYFKKFSKGIRPRHREVVAFLLSDAGFRRATAKYTDQLSVRNWLAAPQQMQPFEAARKWDLPRIESPRALAEWLGVSLDDLRWFADLKGLAHKNGFFKLQHYCYRVLAKDSGSIRLIEAPKIRLKELQRRILKEILQRIPAHPAVHGFVHGRSIHTFAAPHAKRQVVLRMDLRDFFPSFSGVRVQSMFRTVGYPESVADLLGGICTTITPKGVWANSAIPAADLFDLKSVYSRPHLPQGAPTSPLLANLCTYRVDCRLSGLATSAGAEYTRYADDLAFSGDREFEKRVGRFSNHVGAILMEEGFAVHFRKTRIMRQGVRQHLGGLVLNQGVNVMRPDFELLKAMLTNCVRFGPASQNRDQHAYFRAHLVGRVSYMEAINPTKGRRLRSIFERIEWLN